MSQEIKIGVAADVGGAETNMKRLDQAAGHVSDTVTDIADAARQAAAQLEAVERATRRLSAAQQTLQGHFGRAVSEADTAQALANFGRMRSGRGIGAKRLQQFDSFESWWQAGGGAFATPSGRAQHQSFVLNGMMQGTGSQGAPAGPAVPPGFSPTGGFGGGAGGGGGGGFRPGSAPGFGTSSGWLGKIGSTALGVASGGLALAGVGSLMSMAGRAIDLATNEARSTDETKRRLGGLGVDYYGVQDQTRGAAEALRTDYVGAAAYGLDYVRGAGNLGGRDLSMIGGMLRTSGQFATAYGIDQGQSVNFFSSMRRLGVGNDEQSGRRLAGQIADAIDRSGYAGKADEIVKTLQDYAETVSHSALARANVTGYASALAGLTSSGIPGLDPQGAAGLLNSADAALRRGGAAGEAGQNFLFSALAQPGMGPFAIQGLMQGGLFASTRSTFGKGTALSGWYRGSLNDVQNIDRIRAQVRRYGLDPQATAASMASVFGLSMSQAHALLTLDGKPLQDAKAAIQAKANDAVKDPYQKMLEAVNGMNKALTDAGDGIQPGVNAIKEGVASLLEHFTGHAPGQQEARKNMLGYHPDGGGIVGAVVNQGKRFAAIAAADLHDLHAAGLMSGWDRKLGLPNGSIALQMYHESRFKDGARSRVGAMGWGQFMPGTVAGLRGTFHDQFGHDPNVWNHDDSVNLTGMYMQQLLKRYGGDYRKALAAYNAGPGTVDRAIRTGKALPAETQAYVAALGTPIPASDRSVPASLAKHEVAVSVSGTATITDSSGKTRGTMILRQAGQPQASGTG